MDVKLSIMTRSKHGVAQFQKGVAGLRYDRASVLLSTRVASRAVPGVAGMKPRSIATHSCRQMEKKGNL